MTKISKNYFDKFDGYNNSLYQYRISLQRGNTDSGHYSDLANKYNILKLEFDNFQNLMTRSERNTLIEVHGRLVTEQKALVIERNDTRSESDLIPYSQRKQEEVIEVQIEALHSQVRALFKIIGEEDVARNDGVVPVYYHQLAQHELEKEVLDAHAFYRMIWKKHIAGTYSVEQFNEVFKGISEQLTKNPMTVADIITFYQSRHIAPLSDNDLRVLSGNTSSVRDNTDNDYVKEVMTVDYKIAREMGSVAQSNTTFLMKDADSFYKFIFNKMIRDDYTAQQFHDLYVDISEKLVRSVLTKDEINKVYLERNIPSLTEEEWNRLIARQETRRQPDNIAEKSGHLAFQGSVHINAGENFTLNVDLYFNEQLRTAAFDIETMPGVLLETARLFNDIFGIRKLGDATDFRIFIFNSRQDYMSYTAPSDLAGHASASDNGNVSSMYLFQGKENYDNPASILCHEFVHALTFQATAKLSLPRTFMEGMAQYVMYKMEGKNAEDIVKMIPAESINRSLKELILTPLDGDDPYKTGPAIVAFLQETTPDFFRKLLFTAEQAGKSDSHFHLYKMMYDFFGQQENKTLKEITWFRDRMSDVQKNFLPGSDDAMHYQPSKPMPSGFLGMQGNGSGSHYADTASHETQQHTGKLIDYVDIQKLYETATEAEKLSVRVLWDKLHAAQYDPIKVTLNEYERRYVERLYNKDIERLYHRDYDDDADSDPEVFYVKMNIEEDEGHPQEVVYTNGDFFG